MKVDRAQRPVGPFHDESQAKKVSLPGFTGWSSNGRDLMMMEQMAAGAAASEQKWWLVKRVQEMMWTGE